MGVVVGACSPSLNWRAVPVQHLVAMLPCKPDQAQRTVDLAATPYTLAVWGCEAGGALFAVSHMRMQSPPAVANAPATPPNQLPASTPTPTHPPTSEEIISAWQTASLRHLPGAQITAVAFTPPVMGLQTSATQAVTPQALTPQAVAYSRKVHVSGQTTGGRATQAQWVWISAGADIYHLAVYAPQLTSAMTEPFFTEIHWK
jgi:hypothetical protein